MNVSYDALKRMIQDVMKEMSAAGGNEMLDRWDSAKPGEETTEEYCMKLVAPKMRKDFINQLNTLEKAAAGKLKDPVKEAKRKMKWGEGQPTMFAETSENKKNQGKTPFYRSKKNPNKKKADSGNTKKLTKKILVKIINDVLEEEDHQLTTGEVTKRREELFPGWETFRQLSKGIVSANETKKKSKLPKSKCGKKGNPYHSAKTGEFYDPKTGGKGSFSRWFQCAEDGRTRMPGGSYKRLAISQPDNCGRSAREKGKDRKCSEPGKKNRE